jgi:glycosyltransferase involved in cell wall biosynthesis
MDQLVSVIVPVYNVEKYIHKCIESLLGQTYKAIEIILVDDGSKDGSGAICDEYASKDSRVKVIHKENGGLSSARNSALEIAQGKYLSFVDSDDYVDVQMYEKMVRACEEYDAGITICNHYVDDDGVYSVENSYLDTVKVYESEQALRLLIEDDYIRNYFCDKLFRADLLEGIRFPLKRNYEDVARMYLLFEKSERICQIPDFMYYYVRHEGSITGHTSDSQWHKNCGGLLLSQKERFEYFFAKNQKMATLCLGNMLKYIYSYMDTGCATKDMAGNASWRKFLLEHEADIKANPYISDKDKRLLGMYTMPDILLSCYCKEKRLVKSVLGKNDNRKAC